MKLIQKLLNEKYAKSASHFMRFVCYFVIAFYIFCLVLGFMGRISFTLHTNSGAGSYEQAIYAEENHAPHSRNLTVDMGDSIHVWANDDGQVDRTIQVGLSLMYAINIIPLIFAFWLLSRVFFNVSQGQIFVPQNAAHLLYYGLIQFSVGLFVPCIKLLICYFTNLISSGRMTIHTGSNMLNLLIPSIAFIVAAYIIHYGIDLQDEVDHTL